MKLTQAAVDALLRRAPELNKQGRLKDTFSWDGELRGFGVRAMPSRLVVYLIQYRSDEGRQRRMHIGSANVLKVDEARKIAREKLAEVEKGGDPAVQRQRLRGGLMVSELCDLYLEEAAKETWRRRGGRVKASTLAMDKSRIEAHVKRLIGNRKVAALTSADVVQMQDDIAAGKTAKVRPTDEHGQRIGRGAVPAGGPSVASRTVGMLGTILEFARRRELIDRNPVWGVARFPDVKQDRFLSRDELVALGAALRDAEREAIETHAPTIAFASIRFLALTGLRRNEALALPRLWVDREARCVRFKDTKSGRQVRAVGRAALAAIEPLLSDERQSAWVFPSDIGAGHFVGLPRVLARLCARAALDGVTLHVLRHTFGSVAAGLGYSELTIAGLLGHSLGGITARYAHVPDASLIAAADVVSAAIAAALGGVALAPVVEMRA